MSLNSLARHMLEEDPVVVDLDEVLAGVEESYAKFVQANEQMSSVTDFSAFYAQQYNEMNDTYMAEGFQGHFPVALFKFTFCMCLLKSALQSRRRRNQGDRAHMKFDIEPVD